MCHSITFALPRLPDDLKASPILSAFQFNNQGGGHKYDESMMVFGFNEGECSCELFYPYEEFESVEEYIEEAESDKEYGRPEQDIEFSITLAKEEFNKALPFRKDVEKYLLQQVVKQGRVEFIVHWHSGAFESEPFNLKGVVEMHVSDGFQFPRIEEDIRYVLLSGKG